jgi:hypothetical protein
VSNAERIVQYRDCLKRCDSTAKFYHRSFETDELGTSALLLGWRDLWHLHGWDGRAVSTASLRLHDMAEINAYAQGTVAPGIGERLVAVLRELDHRPAAIESIVLEDKLGDFPMRWQQVLARLPVVPAADRLPSGDGALGKLQQALISSANGMKMPQAEWLDDGTLEFVQSETRGLAGRWLAQRLAGDSDILLMAANEGQRLDSTLAASNVARQGLRESSAFRPALQLLPLVLELLWAPINFHALVQFLTHPVCPLPAQARRRLAEKVARSPGIGGSAWDKALSDIDSYYNRTSPERALEVRRLIAYWIESPRHSADMGVPVGVAIDRVVRLSEFFRMRLADPSPAQRLSFNAAFGQCRACAESLSALASQGMTVVKPRQLQTLATQATAQGSENPLWVAEVGAHRVIDAPGAAVEAAREVIWWQAAMPALPAAYPWSEAEIRALSETGATLPSMADRLRRAASTWLRPIIAARSRLTIVLPPPGEEVHPVWQMIKALIKEPPVRSLESVIASGEDGARPVAHRPLPVRRRWWQLPADIDIPLRQEDSFSSLELLLFNPYHWLLKYPARLRPSRTVQVANDFLLRGNLAHNLVEQHFLEPDAVEMTDAEFDTWFELNFPRLIAEEGAPFLMPGRSAELEGFRIRLKTAMTEIRAQVAAAGAVAVVPEMELTGQYAGGRLKGYADLVLELPASGERQQAVVDMKWAGRKKYAEKLRDGGYLQLAIYAELIRQRTGKVPALAYCILNEARFIAPDNNTLPSAFPVFPKNGENAMQLWQRFTASWRWRRAQLDARQIEVALQGTPDEDPPAPPEDGLTPEYLNESYNEYLALAGWEE